MRPVPCRFLLSLLFLLPFSLYAAQEISSVEAKIKTLMLDPRTQSPIVVLETVTDKTLPVSPYSPAFERGNCGIGFVADEHGRTSHEGVHPKEDVDRIGEDVVVLVLRVQEQKDEHEKGQPLGESA